MSWQRMSVPYRCNRCGVAILVEPGGWPYYCDDDCRNADAVERAVAPPFDVRFSADVESAMRGLGMATTKAGTALASALKALADANLEMVHQLERLKMNDVFKGKR